MCSVVIRIGRTEHIQKTDRTAGAHCAPEIYGMAGSNWLIVRMEDGRREIHALSCLWNGSVLDGVLDDLRHDLCLEVDVILKETERLGIIYRLTPEDLGVDPNGDPVTSVNIGIGNGATKTVSANTYGFLMRGRYPGNPVFDSHLPWISMSWKSVCQGQDTWNKTIDLQMKEGPGKDEVLRGVIQVEALSIFDNPLKTPKTVVVINDEVVDSEHHHLLRNTLGAEQKTLMLKFLSRVASNMKNELRGSNICGFLTDESVEPGEWLPFVPFSHDFDIKPSGG